jgi:hypothetical protein
MEDSIWICINVNSALDKHKDESDADPRPSHDGKVHHTTREPLQAHVMKCHSGQGIREYSSRIKIRLYTSLATKLNFGS